MVCCCGRERGERKRKEESGEREGRESKRVGEWRESINGGKREGERGER